MKWYKTLFFAAVLLLASQRTVVAQEVLSLDDCIALAMENNINVRAANLQYLQAQQQRREFFTRFFPTIEAAGGAFAINHYVLDVEFMNTPIMQYIKTGTYGIVNATQPLFAGGRLLNGNKLARLGVDVSRLQQQKTADEVRLATEKYYWDLVVLQVKRTTIAVLDTMITRLLTDVSAAVGVGVRMRNDLLEVQLRQSEIAGDRLKVEHGLSTTRRLLAQYIGKDSVAICQEIDFNSIPSSPAAVKKDHEAVLLGTSDYRLLEKNVRATTLNRRLELGKHLPQVAVGAGITSHTILDGRQNLAAVYATLSVPLTSWWGGAHALKRLRYAETLAKEQLDDNSVLLLIQMENTWNAVEEAYEELTIVQQAVGQAQENLRLSNDYYRAGTIPLSDLLQAQTLYQQTTNRYVQAYADYHLALSRYAVATTPAD